MKRALLGLAALALVATAGAQSRPAFKDVDSISDILVTGGGLDWTVHVGSAPMFMWGPDMLDIISVIGFFALANDGDVIATAQNLPFWGFETNNAEGGGVAGWQTNWAGGMHGIDVNQSMAFHFTTLDLSTVDQWGYKVVVDGFFPGTSGNTGFITTGAVPEPASLIGLACMTVLLLNRRKR